MVEDVDQLGSDGMVVVKSELLDCEMVEEKFDCEMVEEKVDYDVSAEDNNKVAKGDGFPPLEITPMVSSNVLVLFCA